MPQFNQQKAQESQAKAAEMNQLYNSIAMEGPFGSASLSGTGADRKLTGALSEQDQLREDIIGKGLGGLNLDPAQATQKYYDQALAMLQPQMEAQTNQSMDRLTQMGIDPGSTAFGSTMGEVAKGNQLAMNQLATDAMRGGQQYISGQVGNLGALQSQIKNPFANLPMSNQNYFSSGYEKQLADQQAAVQRKNERDMANIQAGTQLLGMGAGMMSDKRLKENLKKVGELDNGLNVYLGNYTKESGLDMTPQLFLIAQEVQEKNPKAVMTSEDGFLAVDYEEAVK